MIHETSQLAPQRILLHNKEKEKQIQQNIERAIPKPSAVELTLIVTTFQKPSKINQIHEDEQNPIFHRQKCAHIEVLHRSDVYRLDRLHRGPYILNYITIWKRFLKVFPMIKRSRISDRFLCFKSELSISGHVLFYPIGKGYSTLWKIETGRFPPIRMCDFVLTNLFVDYVSSISVKTQIEF